MEKFIIKGGKKLSGEIKVKGAKNSALKIFAASVLAKKPWQIKNVPNIEDINRMAELLKDAGSSIEKTGSDSYTINSAKVKNGILDENKTRKLRSSIVLVGPLLARLGRVKFYHPGGCILGKRPIDIFFEGFKSLGASVRERKNSYIVSAKELHGNTFFFRKISVTATETLMMAAILAKGKTILKNCAQEPEIKSLADFLNKCGAKIIGAGTSTIEIQGTGLLGGGSCRVIPDRIEAGSFAVLAAASRSKIKITHCNPSHLESLWQAFREMGVNFSLGKNYVMVDSSRKLSAIDIKTHEYPGFVTDIQPPFTVLLTQARGLSKVHETIFEGRLFYTDILNNMGANIILCDPNRAVVSGPTKLFGAKVFSPDLRAGIGLIIAGLIAKGTTTIDNIYQIDRGYENIDERLRELGADVQRIKE